MNDQIEDECFALQNNSSQCTLDPTWLGTFKM